MAKKVTFARWFYKQSKLLQILLLLIPFVNWVVEICIRWSAALSRPRLLTIVCAVVATIFGAVFGWIDLIWLLIFNHLLFAKA